MAVSITRIPKLNVLVIKQGEDDGFFYSAKNSIVIDIYGFAVLIKFLVMHGYISHRILEGVIDEYKSSKQTLT